MMGWFERDAIVGICIEDGSERKRENGEDGEDMGVDHLWVYWSVGCVWWKISAIWTCE